jgi:hypothetical protein
MKAHITLIAVLSTFSLTSWSADPPAPDAAVTLAIDAVGSKDWAEYLVDTSSGSVSASGVLGISGESVTTIENVRDVVVALKGLSSDESKEMFGLSITPARTSITPMDIKSYWESWPMRLLGSLTLSYAQGAASIEGVDFDRKAFAIDTNFFFHGADDPVIATALAYGSKECDILQAGLPASALPATAIPATGGATVAGAVHAPQVAEAEHASAVIARAEACKANALAALRWNRSQLSIAYGAGRIKPKSGDGSESSLGRTLSAGLVYGFDGFERLGGFGQTLRNKLSLAINYRKTWDEPILQTLVTPQIKEKDSTLTVVRLTGGSNTFRFLAEVSDASSQDITASQRAFKQAFGFDVRVFDKTWINLRVGKQRTLDGTREETGSLLSLSYSPTALLNR